jgi:acyl transferase domain-containing protein
VRFIAALAKISKDRFDAKAFHGGPIGELNSSVTDSGHFIKGDIKNWDLNFFRITPEEAKAMDPQQRLMMEVAFVLSIPQADETSRPASIHHSSRHF